MEQMLFYHPAAETPPKQLAYMRLMEGFIDFARCVCPPATRATHIRLTNTLVCVVCTSTFTDGPLKSVRMGIYRHCFLEVEPQVYMCMVRACNKSYITLGQQET